MISKRFSIYHQSGSLSMFGRLYSVGHILLIVMLRHPPFRAFR